MNHQQAFERLALICALAIVATACTPSAPAEEPGMTPRTAETTCRHLRELHCEEGYPVEPLGTTCETFMGEADLRGLISVSCILHANSREVLRSNCNVRCKEHQ
jgi:hypothetical protein